MQSDRKPETKAQSEDNKLKALNDILKGSNPFPALKKEEEEEFDLFIQKLNDKDIATKQVMMEESKYEKDQESEEMSPVKGRRRPEAATTVLD